MENNNLLSYECTNEIRGIAIILVILGHANLIKEGGAWGVSLFLILSGFGLMLSYLKNGLNNFFIKKIRRVILPYSFVTFLCILADKLLFHKNYGLFKSLIYVLGFGFKSPVDGTMWYITYLIIWYITFYIIFKFDIKLRLKIVFIFIAAISSYILISNILPNTTVIRNYSFCFPLGVIVGYNFKNIIMIKSIYLKKYLLILSLILMITFTVFQKHFLIGKDQINSISVIAFGLGCICIISFLNLYIMKLDFLNIIGHISYELYLLEGIFLWKYNFIFNLAFNIYIKISIYCIFIAILSILLKYILNKFFTLIARHTTDMLKYIRKTNF